MGMPRLLSYLPVTIAINVGRFPPPFLEVIPKPS
jgi:hypothetical protein